MYLRFTEPFDLTEDELKEQIVLSAKDLAENWPEHFACDSELIPELQSETTAFIARIAGMSEFAKIGPMLVATEPIRALRTIYRFLHVVRWSAEIELRMLGVISLMFSTQFLGFRYIVAVSLIEKVLQEPLNYNYDLLCDHLLNPYGTEDIENSDLFAIAAEYEIDRVAMDPRTRERFLDVITRFEDGIEAQTKKAMPSIIAEVAFRLMSEAMIVNAGIIDEEVQDSDELDVRFFGEILEKIMLKGKRFTNERVGIKRGGPRKTDKFVWTSDRKREFYETVSSIVPRDGQPLWKFAYEELIEKDFSNPIILWLRTETALKDAPMSLWNEAVKVWESSANDFGTLPSEKTPEAFAMLHAIHILSFPKIKLSTMKKYLGQGKKLSQANIDS
jgi:hypothetical protein